MFGTTEMVLFLMTKPGIDEASKFFLSNLLVLCKGFRLPPDVENVV